MATITTSDARLHTLPPATGRAGLRGAIVGVMGSLTTAINQV